MKWCFGLFAALVASTACAADPPAKAAKPDPAALAGVIDAQVATTLKAHNVPASPRADDATFFRRVNLALAGRVPVPSEVRLFLADTDPNKRAKVIDKLLASAAHANHLTTTWRAFTCIHGMVEPSTSAAAPATTIHAPTATLPVGRTRSRRSSGIASSSRSPSTAMDVCPALMVGSAGATCG